MASNQAVKVDVVDNKENKGKKLADKSIRAFVDVEELKKIIGSIAPTSSSEPEATHIKVSGRYYNYTWMGIYDKNDERAALDGNLCFYSSDVMWEKDDGTKLSNLDIYRAMQNGEKFAVDFYIGAAADYVVTPEDANSGYFYYPYVSPSGLIIPGESLVSRTRSGEIDLNGAGQFSATYGALYCYGATVLTIGFRFYTKDNQEIVEFFATMPGNFDRS